MEIVVLTVFLFVVSYVILFIVSLALLEADLIEPRTVIFLMTGGFFAMGIMSGLIGLLFKALLIMGG